MPVGDILAMSADTAIKHKEVVVEGTVYACNPVFGYFFIYDEHTPMFVQYPETGKLKTGRRVRIQGTVIPGEPNHFIDATDVKVVGNKSPLRQADKVVLDRLNLYDFDCRWVELETVEVRSAFVDGELTTLVCDQHGSPFYVCMIGGISDADLGRLVGSEISVTGNLGVYKIDDEVKGVAVNSDVSLYQVTAASNAPMEFPPYSKVGGVCSRASRFFRVVGKCHLR